MTSSCDGLDGELCGDVHCRKLIGQVLENVGDGDHVDIALCLTTCSADCSATPSTSLWRLHHRG
eukprot:CAMPEP_0174706772 /NCGR_PEP_ID=MMETSP1094-20130205/9496_1 /TAXON_ID=156173 /ORGANISM="Chrysochromulina brevifilum, Strain UTEX LB 985" /LENGTH=63 /DNA_ID=CAMNT_0015905077 /DNA_START=338 /DNA_END=529 /DNA_ORIENTATION=+